VSLADNICQIKHFQDLITAELGDIKAIEAFLKTEKADNSNLDYQLMAANYGKHVNYAILSWCDETLSRLKNLSREEKMADIKGDESYDPPPVY